MQDFSDIAKKIENRASLLTEALQQELQSLEAVEQTLNKRYQQSVTNVLDSLTHSMQKQEKELIEHKMNVALDLISNLTAQTVEQTQERMEGLREEMTEIRMEMLEEEQKTLQRMKHTNQSITKMQAKQWIYPTLVGICIVLGMAVGTWAVSERLSIQLETLKELRETIAQTKKTQDKYIKKVWSNAVGVKEQPTIWKDEESNLWIIQYEKSN